MAVVAVTFDGTRVNDADALGTLWDDLGGGKTNLETDVILQGTNSVSEKVGTSESGVKYFDTGTSNDFSTTPRVALLKVNVSNYKVLNNEGATGGILEIGSADRVNYYRYYVVGGDTYPVLGGWIIEPIDPNLVGWRDATVGTPVLTTVDNYSFAADFSATSKVENVVIDAIDFMNVGAGLTLVGGDSTDPDGVFQDFIDEDQDTVNNRWGVVTTREGVLIVRGTLTIGTATATVFNDNAKVLIFAGDRIGTGFGGIDVGLQSATNDIDFTACVFVGRQNPATTKYFDTITDVDAAGEDITITAHGFVDGDYILYSDEGGTDTIGLTDGNNYWVNSNDVDTVSFHNNRQDAINDASRVNLTDGSGGENHSIILAEDARPDLTVTDTTGDFDATSCTFDNFNIITLTSAVTITGGFVLRTGNVALSTGTLTGVTVSTQTTAEGVALLDPLTTLANITNCIITAGTEGHFARLTSTGTFAFAGNTLNGFWTPTISGANNGWEFDTITGVDDATEVITTNAAHGFTTGDAVFYNDEGLTDTIGLTDLAKYYVNVISTTTVSMHRSRENATADSNRINLTDGSTGETHSLYSGKAALFNDSAGAITVNVSGGGTTPFVRNGSGATTTVNNTVTIEVTGVTEGSRVFIEQVSDGTDLLNALAFTSDGAGAFKADASFNYVADTAVTIRARSSGKPVAAIADDNGVFTDETINANSSTDDDMNLLPATPVVNEDRYLFGHTEQFGQMRLDISTVGTGGFTITWQYFNGTIFTALSGVTDGSSSFSVLGESVISWTIPGDWATTTINSQGPYFYIRAAYTAGSVTITPLGRKVTFDVTKYLAFVQTNTIVSTGLSVKAVWVEDTIAQF